MDRDFFRKYLDILSESSPPQVLAESIELHDSFDIELNENFVIETGIIGFTKDGVIIEADETLLGLLEVNDILCEDETYDQEEEEVAEDEQSGKPYQPMDRYKHLVDRAKGDWKWKREDGSPVTPEDLETIKKTKRDILNQMQSDEANPNDADENVFTKFINLFKEDEEEQYYKPPSGYSELDNTMMSVVDTLKNTSSTKNNKTNYGTDWSSTSVARNPKDRSGSYLQTQYQTKDGKDVVNKQDFQQNVSSPWLDYTLNKAKQDSDTMMQEPDGPVKYQSMPQGPMTKFRARTNEAEYQGRKVQLGKPMAGDVAKSKVYVKKPNGKIVKVNFGDKNMKIKKSNPKRRKSFRARHRCENPGPRWKARYWSCRAW